MRLSGLAIAVALPLAVFCSSNPPRAAQPVFNLQVAPNTLLTLPTGAALNLHIGRAAQPTIEPRAVGVEINPAAAQPTAQSQYPSVTTQWEQYVSTVNGARVTTWVEKIYTQTFAAVPSQGPPPGQGVIGLGTVTGEVGQVRTEQAKADAGRVSPRALIDGWGVLGMVGLAGAAVGGALVVV